MISPDTIALISAVAIAVGAILVPLTQIKAVIKTLCSREEANLIAQAKVDAYDKFQQALRKARKLGADESKTDNRRTPAHGVPQIGE